MYGVFLAMRTILVHLKSVCILLLVLFRCVVTILALCACQCDGNSHFTALLFLFEASLSAVPLPENEAQKNRPANEVLIL